MRDLKKIKHLDFSQQLINKLMVAGYSFAAWKMPGDYSIQLIISLNGVEKSDDFSIAEAPAGFLVNTYDANHPIQPYHIAADIIIEEASITVHPTVKDTDIDRLLDSIDAEPNLKSERKTSAEKLSANHDFEQMVENAVNRIKEDEFEKVVLSRYKDEPLPEDFAAWDFFESLCQSYPNAFNSLCHIPGKGLWVGATPEILISDNQERFLTISLAGTKSLTENNDLSEIAWTQKEIEEQAFVSRYVINCFKKIRLREFHEHGPKTVQAGNLAHLKTEFRVNYDEVEFDGLADQMLELLHPTSAVCGMPIDKAKPWIKETEAYDREFYSGFLGPVNFNHSTDLFVNLRCMKIFNNAVRFYAGAGITEDSSPQKEFQETEMKMNVLKSKIVNGNR